MFHHIDLEPPNKKGDCYDYVEVRNDLNQVAGEKFCGTKTDAEPILSVGNKLSVSFHSDDSRGARGFKSSVWEGKADKKTDELKLNYVFYSFKGGSQL